MKRHQKTFSVEIKKSRTQGPRQHLAPRPLFATPPDETTPSIQKAESQALAEPVVVARRILPSIVAVVPTSSEDAIPTHRRQALRSKADREQIEFDLFADPIGEGMKVGPDLLPTLDRSKADSPLVAEERTAAEDEIRRQDVQSRETKARKRRTKISELVDPVETSPPVAASLLVQADLMASAGVATSQKACHRRLTKRQAAAVQLPRNERWKRRLHPAAW